VVDFAKQTYQYIDKIITLEGPLSEVVKELLDIQESVDEEYRDDVQITVDCVDDFYEVRFFYLRDKTEAELALEEAQRARYKEYRRQQYEQMKKEFEGE
jgi:hypothetical protein